MHNRPISVDTAALMGKLMRTALGRLGGTNSRLRNGCIGEARSSLEPEVHGATGKRSRCAKQSTVEGKGAPEREVMIPPSELSSSSEDLPNRSCAPSSLREATPLALSNALAGVRGVGGEGRGARDARFENEHVTSQIQLRRMHHHSARLCFRTV